MNRINQALGGCDRAAIRPLVHHLVKAHYPNTVVDYGCGDGAWLSEFHRLGIRTIGVDRTDRIRHDIGAFVAHDLSKPGINFDNAVVGVRVEEPSIALCLEVAEHLPCSAADGLIDILTAHPVVAFSAAIPGQGGWGHKNERWQSWWAAKFASRGFYPDLSIRRKFWSSTEVPCWYRQNLIVYTRCRFGRIRASSDLDVIHPDLWMRRSLLGTVARIWRFR